MKHLRSFLPWIPARLASILFSPFIWGFLLLLALLTYIFSPEEGVLTTERRAIVSRYQGTIQERLIAISKPLAMEDRVELAVLKSALANPPLKSPRDPKIVAEISSDDSCIQIEFQVGRGGALINPYDLRTRLDGILRFQLPLRESYSKDDLLTIRPKVFTEVLTKSGSPLPAPPK